MELLKERIVRDGKVIDNRILKVDSFLNHQMDINLFNEMGKEFKERFKDIKIDKILTIEASGIGPACITAQYFNVPAVFAKKTMSSNLSADIFTTEVYSFTKETTYNVYVSKEYIKEGENILFIDDFLAHGEAVLGIYDLAKQAKANISGVGIIIEKQFQGGRKKFENIIPRVESLAIIKSMENGNVIFD